jgi:hypothetical protein
VGCDLARDLLNVVLSFSVDPGRQLTGTIMGDFMPYVLVPGGHGTTRPLPKVVSQAAFPAGPPPGWSAET